jgi:hypothetical protein
VPCGGPVGNAPVSDPGAFVEMNPGGSGGAGPAPGGGVDKGISPGGVPANPYGSWAWCQASLRKPNGPGLLPCPYWGFGTSGTGGGPTGGGGAGATGAPAAATTGCPDPGGAAPGVAGTAVGEVGTSGSAFACPARASAPRLTVTPANANLTALMVGEVTRVR